MKFIQEVRKEMRKVTFPTRHEVITMTALVIIVSLAVGAYIGVIDVTFAKVMETLVQ